MAPARTDTISAIAKKKASRTFETGPAAAPRVGPLRVLAAGREVAGLEGGGVAQAGGGTVVKVWISGKGSGPVGSMCALGLRLARPRSLAVLSPGLQAIHACADS